MERAMRKSYPWHLCRFLLLNSVLVILLALGGPGRVKAVEHDPLTQIKGSVEEILNILRDEQLAAPEKRAERRSKVEAVVDSAFDFEEMAKHSLAGNWSERTPAEQKEFVDLFARLVKERYIGKIDSYSGQKVVFKKQIVRGDKALIYSLLADKTAEIPIDYKLIHTNDDKWLVYDMRIENISLVANYRQDFFSIIKQEGFEGLIRKMKEKVEKLEESR